MSEQTTANGPDQPIRVLIIDDEEIVHRSVGRILKRAGYHSDAVFSAAEGLDRLEKGQYNLVITDLMMPKMNGIELVRAIHRSGATVPVIMITGYPTIKTALQAMRYGARDYLAKPFTRKELLGPVNRALRQEGSEERNQRERPTGAYPKVELSKLIPGTRYYLPHHAWAEFQQDGHFLVGVETSFLSAAGPLTGVALPTELDMLDQGTVGLRLTNADGEEHGVAMPLSGQVAAVNAEAAAAPGSIEPGTWLIRLLPAQVDGELENLVRRK